MCRSRLMVGGCCEWTGKAKVRHAASVAAMYRASTNCLTSSRGGADVSGSSNGMSSGCWWPAVCGVRLRATWSTFVESGWSY
jgi:hypothetical protein